MKKSLLHILLLSMPALLLAACNIDEVIEETLSARPEITLDSPTGIYTVKVGKPLTVTPTVVNGDDARYEWVCEGERMSTAPVLTFVWETEGERYITLTVSNEAGSASEEFRVDVVGLTPPAISLAVPPQGLKIIRGAEYLFAPEILNADTEGFRCEWSVDGTRVAEGISYLFCSERTGVFTVVCIASNTDGIAEASAQVEVVETLPCDLFFTPLSATNGSTDRFAFIGTPVVLAAVTVNMTSPRFVWSVDGEIIERDGGATFRYVPATAGEHTVRVIASEGDDMTSVALAAVTVVGVDAAPEERLRPATAASSAEWSTVFEYTPAPGQFIGDMQTAGFDGSESTPADAIAYAERRLRDNLFVSLGSWGGYIVVGFDHSIRRRAADGEGYDFSIGGNAFNSNNGSSNEPGIVWVMQDVNGNGLPDDEWLELRGCETGKASTRQNWSVTYHRPAAAGMSVQWTDLAGGSGTVDYLKAYHRQESYYPAWLDGETATFCGTLLEARNRQTATGNWANDSFEWGYADNAGDDNLADGGIEGEGQLTGFRIANAMYADGTPADLQYIDFIKVQSGVLAKSGWLGENSTEVFSFRDLAAE